MNSCEYCQENYQNSDRTILENDLWFANFDKHEVSPGHIKIIPKRHVNSIKELTDDELIAMREIFTEVDELTKGEFNWDGYNFGYNHGKAAGQTKFHLHLHYIPRYEGDDDDPIGGVRKVKTGKGNYLKLSD